MIDSRFEVVKWNAQDYGFPLRLQFGKILYRGFNMGLMGCWIRLKVEGHNEMNKIVKAGCGMSSILRVGYGTATRDCDLVTCRT